MTKTVARDEIVDYVTYQEQRRGARESAMRAKDVRRVHVGPHLTFLFENHETIRYQVQEMMRTEQMVKEDPALRAEKLAQWLALPKHLYAKRADGTKAYARYDERQVGDTRVSSVQYLKFQVGVEAPLAMGCDHPDPELHSETPLTPEQRAALQRDLDE
jgi:hypothetical protein